MSWENKRYVKREPLLRYAKTEEEVLNGLYIVPKEDAKALLVEGMHMLFPDLDIDEEESLAMSLALLQYIDNKVKNK
jgi:hypothetical protein